MSRQAQVEEVSDSDPEDMDPSDFDPGFAQESIISPANIPAPTASAPSQPPSRPPQQQQQQQQREIPKHFHCLYPVYFDSTRSRAEGRKVGKEHAVENPLARDIVDAVQMVGLQVALEPEKIHPKDWANPGRVRVLLHENGKLQNPKVKNKHHLHRLVGEYLRAHPTTEHSPFRLRIRGLPTPEKPVPAPAAPRGWKIGTVLPLHSPAITGGGISDNPIKEAMMEMQGMQGLEGASDTPNNGEGKKKKDKKKGKA